MSGQEPSGFDRERDFADPRTQLAEAGLELDVASSLDTVEDLLLESVQHSSELVDELTGHLARAGGKRLRPVLTLIAARLGAPHRVQSDPVIEAAAAVELTHLASLYHDDVMDSAPSRRGVDATQILWGNNRAILAGDLLFARASGLVARLGPASVAYHAQTFERLCLGQLHETFGPGPDDDPVEFYLQVLADKTGSLVAASAYFGALHAGAGEEVARKLEAFGERVGVAFQLADDVLDIASPREVSGKTPGTDLLEGVDTMPVLLLRKQQAGGTLDEQGQRILDLLDEDLSVPENLAAVVQLLRQHPVLEETRQLAQQWADQAIDALEGIGSADVQEALESFALMMVDRAS